MASLPAMTAGPAQAESIRHCRDIIDGSGFIESNGDGTSTLQFRETLAAPACLAGTRYMLHVQDSQKSDSNPHPNTLATDRHPVATTDPGTGHGFLFYTITLPNAPTTECTSVSTGETITTPVVYVFGTAYKDHRVFDRAPDGGNVGIVSADCNGSGSRPFH
jgi:hypothetical protein